MPWVLAASLVFYLDIDAEFVAFIHDFSGNGCPAIACGAMQDGGAQAIARAQIGPRTKQQAELPQVPACSRAEQRGKAG